MGSLQNFAARAPQINDKILAHQPAPTVKNPSGASLSGHFGSLDSFAANAPAVTSLAAGKTEPPVSLAKFAGKLGAALVSDKAWHTPSANNAVVSAARFLKPASERAYSGSVKLVKENTLENAKENIKAPEKIGFKNLSENKKDTVITPAVAGNKVKNNSRGLTN